MHAVIKVILATALLLVALSPHATEVTVPDDPARLDDTGWWVEDIGGRGVVDASHTTIAFGPGSRVTGDTGCNRYSGTAWWDGSAMRFSTMAVTRRACAESLMDQEMRFLQAMNEVDSWVIPDTGLLHLRTEQGETVIRAWRIETQDDR